MLSYSWLKLAFWRMLCRAVATSRLRSICGEMFCHLNGSVKYWSSIRSSEHSYILPDALESPSSLYASATVEWRHWMEGYQLGHTAMSVQEITLKWNKHILNIEVISQSYTHLDIPESLGEANHSGKMEASSNWTPPAEQAGMPHCDQSSKGQQS